MLRRAAIAPAQRDGLGAGRLESSLLDPSEGRRQQTARHVTNKIRHSDEKEDFSSPVLHITFHLRNTYSTHSFRERTALPVYELTFPRAQLYNELSNMTSPFTIDCRLSVPAFLLQSGVIANFESTLQKNIYVCMYKYTTMQKPM